MVTSQMNGSLNKHPATRQGGLTLIEVLIALAIASIALTAIIKTTTQHIRATAYLQEKTIAMWVAAHVLNEIETGLLVLPEEDGALKENEERLGQDWYWVADKSDTPNTHIKKITVNVFANEDDETTPIAHVEGYLYHAQ